MSRGGDSGRERPYNAVRNARGGVVIHSLLGRLHCKKYVKAEASPYRWCAGGP
jgi:hypothetical protein